MDIQVIVLFVVGLGLLVLGAEWLVRGASKLAAAAGLSSLAIGLTVVAFGTSAPEMAVSVKAAWLGQSDMAVGNVVGSNVFNVLFILGVSAIITPLLVAQPLVRRDVPLMIFFSFVVLLLSLDGGIGRLEGIGLLATLVAYTVWLLRASRREQAAVVAEVVASESESRLWVDIAYIVGGLGLLVLGSQWLVASAVAFADWLGVSSVVVGLTIVAAGTSLPELATSILAALRGERDIAVGNVVGSNIFNLLAVLGLAGSLSPTNLSIAPSMSSFDIPFMIAVAVACLPIYARGHVIPRWQGFVFLALYVAYTTYLVLDATGHTAKEGYVTVMLEFVIPLTLLTFVVMALRARREPRLPPGT